jgi:microcystin-dependent protein
MSSVNQSSIWNSQRIFNLWNVLWLLRHVGEYKLSNRSTDFDGFLLCDGRSLDRNEYHLLFSVIGTTYGSADSQTFRVPDFRARVIGAAGSTRTLGTAVGSEEITLSVPQLPSHSHTGTTNAAGSHTHSHNANGGAQPGLVTANGTGTATEFDNGGANELKIDAQPIALTVQAAGEHTHAFTTNTTGSGSPISVMQPTLFGVNVFIYSGGRRRIFGV